MSGLMIIASEAVSRLDWIFVVGVLAATLGSCALTAAIRSWRARRANPRPGYIVGGPDA